MFCSYCGTQIIATNENEHIYRHIDEAKIREDCFCKYQYIESASYQFPLYLYNTNVYRFYIELRSLMLCIYEIPNQQ